MRTPEPSPLRAESHMQWAWGRLPKVSPSVSTPGPAFQGLRGPLGSGLEGLKLGPLPPKLCEAWEAGLALAHIFLHLFH